MWLSYYSSVLPKKEIGDKKTMNINVIFKENIEEPELFENMDGFEIKNGKFLFLYANCNTELEWYLPLENILYFQIEYEEVK